MILSTCSIFFLACSLASCLQLATCNYSTTVATAYYCATLLLTMNEEYIDYSCSTPLERLSRDVETILRSWYIIEGSDRHVSFHDSDRKPKIKMSNPSATKKFAPPSVTKGGKTYSTPLKEFNRCRLLSPPRSALRNRHLDSEDASIVLNNSHGNFSIMPHTPRSPLTPQGDFFIDETEDIFNASLNDSVSSALPFHTPPRTRKDLYAMEDARKHADIQLIRSGKITFATIPPNSTHHKDRIHIELDLCLWDGPPAADHYTENQTRKQKLPLSLIANSQNPFPKANILSNLSSLLGIGQHLTLSPSDPSAISSFLRSTMEALEDANHPNKKRPLVGLIAITAISNNESVNDIVALHTAALASLSNQLQMALNTAVVNCDSRIPAFGIWGIYKPHLKKTHDKNGEESLEQSVMEVPTWMNGGDLFNLASDESICSLYRKQIESMRIDYDNDGIAEDHALSESGGVGRTTPVGTPQRKRDKHGKIRTPSRIPPNMPSPMRQFNSNSAKKKGELYLPAFLTGRCHAGESFFANGAQFGVHVIPPGIEYPVHCTTLNSLGQLLLQHCPSPAKKEAPRKSNRTKLVDSCDEDGIESKVVVSGARHKYTWSKIFQFKDDRISRQHELLLASPFSSRFKTRWEDLNIMTYSLSWRKSANSQLIYGDGTMSTEEYLQACRAHALKMLFRASCGAKTNRAKKTLVSRKGLEPLWGPVEDPVSQISVTATWEGDKKDTLREMTPCCEKINPLLTLPLRIRSNNSMTSEDILEMESTILSTVFNPLSSSDFQVSATFDANAACTTLSATNRCLLASLIRACTLDQSYLLGHMTKSIILEELHQRDELDLVADEIITESNVSQMTRNLVEVMDWASMADMLDHDANFNENRMCDIVEQLFVACAEDDQYPSPPEEVFDDSRDHDQEMELHSQSYLEKASRPGRLLSILFTSMSALQTPSAMAALWMEFVSELRMMWEKRESIPNLGPIPGLDGEDIDDDGEDKIIPTINVLKRKKRRNISNGIGSKAKNAALIYSSERDPDLDDCIISQKLQVFNIGVESMIAEEMKQMKKLRTEESMDAQFSMLDDRSPQKRSAPPQAMEHPPSSTNLKNSSFETDIRSARTKDDDFFDAVGTMYDDELSRRETDTIAMNLSNDESIDNLMAANLGIRRGVRCPVHGASLVESSGMVFAPYVQRDSPLTDDLIVERRNMLTRGSTDNSTVQSRIETAQRMQRPKLLNDMSAFKAANPGAVFQDFVAWYGNPENPLKQYEEDKFFAETTPYGLTSPTKTPEDEAFEALSVLSATRSFWSACWDEAKPNPAQDQDPLFDAFSTVEMLLLWFESMHPAILINQILAVNIAMANFILQSSSPSNNLRPVRDALLRLEEKTSDALQLLSKDVIKSISNPIKSSDGAINSFTYISPETIKTCEGVCTLIGDVEILQSRATSLLSKLNGDEMLVQTIMEAPEGRSIAVKTSNSRLGILNEINSQQQRNSGAEAAFTELPTPSVREYILRNSDEKHPCQLTVSIGGTFGLEVGGANSTKGGLVLALKKSTK